MGSLGGAIVGVFELLDLLLGLGFVYLLFALIASAINEAVAGMISGRAKLLTQALRQLLGTQFDRAMASGGMQPLRKSSTDKNALPDISFVSARELLFAALDVADKSPPIETTPSEPSTPPIAAPKIPPEAISAENLLIRIGRIADGSPIRATLLQLHAEARGDWDAFMRRFEQWFAGFEQHVSNWYRQRVQWWLLIISVVLATAANIDTIALVKHLSSDGAARIALAHQAQQYVDAKGPLASAQLELAAAQTALAQAPSDPAAQKRLIDAQVNNQRVLEEVADALPLPLGWQSWPDDWLAWVLKAFGIVLSAAAITLGAPFWFDFLKKIGSVRAVGPSLNERTQSQSKLS